MARCFAIKQQLFLVYLLICGLGWKPIKWSGWSGLIFCMDAGVRTTDQREESRCDDASG